MIVPFAQRETIDMIISGIYPALKDKVIRRCCSIPAKKDQQKGGKRSARADQKAKLISGKR